MSVVPNASKRNGDQKTDRAGSQREASSVELIVPSIATRLSTNGNAQVASPEAVFPIHSRRKGKDNVFRGRASISDIAHFGINDA